MKINEIIRIKILQYNINKEATKISSFSSWKIGKYENLTGEKILSLFIEVKW